MANLIETKKLKLGKAEISAASSFGTHDLDPSLEVEVWTDKDETKLVPCRTCGRGCIVTQFAAAAKVACSEHRGRTAKTDHIHAVDTSKEKHVLTDKGDTKEVPCRHCGRICVVTRFASAAKVACLDCRKSAPKPKKTTTYKEENGVRTSETVVEIVDEHHQEWLDFVLRRPGHFDSLYTENEKIEHEAQRLASLTLVRTARAARTARQEAEWALTDLPEPEHVKTDKKRAEIVAKRLILSEEIGKQESMEETAELQADEAAERSNRLGRIGFLRGALDTGYRVETRDDHHRYLVRGTEAKCRLPHDYLEPAEYKQVEATPVAA